MIPLLDKVTITGADNNSYPNSLVNISKIYPFTEWGILMSRNNEGGTRFPNQLWIKDLINIKRRSNYRVPLSAHICGYWVRDICIGGTDLYNDRNLMLKHFDRMQLNFHAITHTINIKPFIDILKRFHELGIKQFIFQLDGVNDKLLEQISNHEINAVPLYDTSGGAGLLPDKWVSLYKGYCGYAGGLSPDNINEQLCSISKIALPPIWIDIESKVRSIDGVRLDMLKVSQFLNITKEWVK
jgi:phosphoribosylanthranilate isomerase